MTDFEYIEFDVEKAKLALDGDCVGIYKMCIWGRTTQGYDFWRKEDDRFMRGEFLSDEARSIIEGWIREYEGCDHSDQVDDHGGMIYNPVSGTWSWGF